ncbi:MAG: alpha-ketoglutarate-dependent dioxygenase AlkB family protein [Nitrospirales bacterium]
MDLFETVSGRPRNLLHRDGLVQYYGQIMDPQKANMYLGSLLGKIEWKNDEAIIFGERVVTKRKVAWYGDQPYTYTYSNTTKRALPWIDELLELKRIIEWWTEETFNSCLLNLYHTGMEGVAWHSDAEQDLKKNGAIGSLSFGAERKFSFKHKQTKESISLHLQNGSLLVMKGATQTHWMHRLPPTKMVSTPRVNLTFRTIVEAGKLSRAKVPEN